MKRYITLILRIDPTLYPELFTENYSDYCGLWYDIDILGDTFSSYENQGSTGPVSYVVMGGVHEDRLVQTMHKCLELFHGDAQTMEVMF